MCDSSFQVFNAFLVSQHHLTGLTNLPTHIIPITFTLHNQVSLICEEYGFGGTFDCLYEHEGKHILCDWKTSKWTTELHMEQLAAYGMIVEEHFGPVKDYILVRLDKDTGDVHDGERIAVLMLGS